MMATISDSDTPQLLLILLSTLAVSLFIIPYLQSPLKRIPNAHWSSGLSSFWILWTRYRDQELAVLDIKHRQLGPILRVGPTDLSVSCIKEGTRTIYSGNFEKHSYYDFFSYYGKTNAFSSATEQDHSVRRKRITAVYKKSAIFASKPLSSLTHTILFQRLVPILQGQAKSGEPTDALSLSYALSLDLLTCFQFGLSSGANFLDHPSSLTTWLQHYEQRYCTEAFWPQEFPAATRWLKACGIDMLPQSQASSTKVLEDWLHQMCTKAESACEAAKIGPWEQEGDVPSVYQLVKDRVEAEMPDESCESRQREVASELFDHMSGGREVLGLVLAYTIYYISQNRQAQQKLQAELASLAPDVPCCSFSTGESTGGYTDSPTPRLPSPEILDKLPYLSAVIKESLRMRPNSTPLPRVTPRDRPVSLAGFDDIPPGTRVNVFQWFIHRNPDTCPAANEWQPERWLNTDSKNSKAPILWAFGGGSRICIGAALTQYLMRAILATIYTNYTSVVVSKKSGPHLPGSLEDEISIQFKPISKQ